MFCQVVVKYVFTEKKKRLSSSTQPCLTEAQLLLVLMLMSLLHLEASLPFGLVFTYLICGSLIFISH